MKLTAYQQNVGTFVTVVVIALSGAIGSAWNRGLFAAPRTAKPAPPHVRLFTTPQPFRAVLKPLKTQGKPFDKGKVRRFYFDVAAGAVAERLAQETAKGAVVEIGGMVE